MCNPEALYIRVEDDDVDEGVVCDLVDESIEIRKEVGAFDIQRWAVEGRTPVAWGDFCCDNEASAMGAM